MFKYLTPTVRNTITLICAFLRRTSILLVAAIALAYGFAAHKYRWFPYRLVESLTFALKARSSDEVKRFISAQYSMDTQYFLLERDIETNLIPLTMRGFRLSDRFPVAKAGGAITNIGDRVLIIDRLGQLYSWSSPDHLKKLDFPDLPSNLKDYVALGGEVDEGQFRVYDIKYIQGSNELAVSHEHFDAASKQTRMAVSLIGIEPQSLIPRGSWQTIFSGDPELNGPSESSGGRLAIDPSGDLYLTVGVYEINNSSAAQSDASTFGKVLKIGRTDRSVTMISKGHRNPQGLVLTKKGELWSTEQGPYGGDELNLISPGANYGWPNVTLGTDYGKYSWEVPGEIGRHSGYQMPAFAWLPSIAASNLIEVDKFNARWRGDFLVSSLKAESVFRLRFDGNHVLYVEQIWIGQRIRDLIELPNDTIALWTDNAQLLFLSVNQYRLSSDRRWPAVLSGSLIYSCMYCHHFGPTKPFDAAPTLSNLFGRRIGSDNFPYSPGFRTLNGQWTTETLKAFLENPGSIVNGTSMPRQHFQSAAEIGDVIDDLKKLSQTPTVKQSESNHP